MTTFQSVTNIGDKLLFSSLEDNIKSFLDWGFLNIGGFVNVNIPTSGINGGGFHTLKPSIDPAQTPNTIWESSRKDWVVETGISYSGMQPTNISGIYINNNLIPGPTGNSTYSYRMNYPLGQIVFSSAQKSNLNVSLNYSYRYVQVYKSSESIWWKELQQLSYDPNFMSTNKASLITANHRIQMPAIVVEIIPRTVQIPYELGNVKNIIGQDILLHIYTENMIQRNSIIDILLLQKEKQTYLYDINNVIKNNVQPLNYRGEKNPNGLNYGQIVDSPQYQRQVFYVEEATTSEFNTISSSLYNSIVRWSLKIFP
jgi:hypothetical protein